MHHLNDLLLWEDIQRKTTAENVLKSKAITKFTKEEIAAAYILSGSNASNFDF